MVHLSIPIRAALGIALAPGQVEGLRAALRRGLAERVVETGGLNSFLRGWASDRLGFKRAFIIFPATPSRPQSGTDYLTLSVHNQCSSITQ